MEQFITDDIRVDEALLACFVAAGSGTRLHKDRQSHGLAMYASGQAKYVFDDGKELIAKKNQSTVRLSGNWKPTIVSVRGFWKRLKKTTI